MVERLEVDIETSAPAWYEAFPDVEAICRRAAQAAFAVAGPPANCAEVSLVLADDVRMRNLNRDYRGEDRPTNVLSFAALDAGRPDVSLGADEPLLLGDVVLAYETIASEAIRNGRSPADHLSHLVVHGMLHLFGYDHRTDAEADAMERLEVRVLENLGVPDPYADPSDG